MYPVTEPELSQQLGCRGTRFSLGAFRWTWLPFLKMFGAKSSRFSHVNFWGQNKQCPWLTWQWCGTRAVSEKRSQRLDGKILQNELTRPVIPARTTSSNIPSARPRRAAPQKSCKSCRKTHSVGFCWCFFSGVARHLKWISLCPLTLGDFGAGSVRC